MKRTILALLALGFGGAVNAQSVTNGSFENTKGTFVPDGNDTMALGLNSTAIPGWTVTNTNSVAWIGPTNPFGITASNGDYSLDLQGYGDAAPFGGVAQSISTVVGAQYALSFDLGSGANSAAAIEAIAGTGDQTFTSTIEPTVGWQTETLDFTATGTSTLISLLGITASNGIYIGLDNVRLECTSACGVAAVPEPSTWTMMLTGFGAIGASIAWRRRRSLPRAAI